MYVYPGFDDRGMLVGVHLRNMVVTGPTKEVKRCLLHMASCAVSANRGCNQSVYYVTDEEEVKNLFNGNVIFKKYKSLKSLFEKVLYDWYDRDVVVAGMNPIVIIIDDYKSFFSAENKELYKMWMDITLHGEESMNVYVITGVATDCIDNVEETVFLVEQAHAKIVIKGSVDVFTESWVEEKARELSFISLDSDYKYITTFVPAWDEPLFVLPGFKENTTGNSLSSALDKLVGGVRCPP